MNKLYEAVDFIAEQVTTAEQKLKDGFQASDLLAFVGAALSAPALVSKENRAAISASWKETKAAENGMEELRAHIKSVVKTENPKVEARIEKGAILLFDALDFISELKGEATPEAQ
jgi:hypothetical protein